MIHAVLCHPDDPRNVGTAARAVANHGLSSLRVVTARAFDERDLHAYSSGAVENITYVEVATLDEAIADCHRVVGTSRRRRDTDGPSVWPAAGLRARLGGDAPTAILFGTERTGLTTAELDRCEAVVEVPTTDVHPSLNLAHAVAIIGYELARPAPDVVGPPAAEEAQRLSAEKREAVYGHIHAVVERLGYPPGRSPDAFVRRLRRILHRANLTAEEMSLLTGVFTEMGRLGKLAESAPDVPSGLVD